MGGSGSEPTRPCCELRHHEEVPERGGRRLADNQWKVDYAHQSVNSAVAIKAVTVFPHVRRLSELSLRQEARGRVGSAELMLL